MDLEFKLVEDFIEDNIFLYVNGKEVGSYNFDEDGSAMIEAACYLFQNIAAIVPGAVFVEEEV